MNAGAFTDDVLEFVRTLHEHGVRYLVIGGYAVHFHGYTRFTADIDFAYDPEPANAQRLYDALFAFWDGLIPVVESAEELAQVGMVFQFGRKPNRIDLLSQVDGIVFAEAWARRIVEPVSGHEFPINIVALTDLRASKAAAGRAKDLDDLENLPVPPAQLPRG